MSDKLLAKIGNIEIGLSVGKEAGFYCRFNRSSWSMDACHMGTGYPYSTFTKEHEAMDFWEKNRSVVEQYAIDLYANKKQVNIDPNLASSINADNAKYNFRYND